ncbi:MAG: Membrane protein involved in the export of O-antigen and teichoic acid [Verrucomicrobiaceae bacterium]|nr:Membrane protein involved in the export of O-antigen and teichoic acid [Verrucomicrobiaceae bacterium]
MKLLSGVAWSAVRGWGSRFINLAVFFVAARYLTPSELGVFSLVAAYLMIMQVLGEGGLAEYIVQRTELNPRQDQAIFYSQLFSSGTIALLIAMVAPWVAPLLVKHADAVPLFIVSAITIPLTAVIRVPEAIMRKGLRFKALAYRGLLTSGIAGVVTMFMAYRGFGIWALVVKQVLEAIIDALLIFIASRWNPGLPKFDREVLKEPYAYGKHILGARLLDTLYLRIDTFLIGNFIGSAALGYYSVGQKIYQALIELLSKVFSNVAVPYMAREKNNPEAVKKIYLQFVQLVATIALPGFVYIFIFSPELIVLTFGAKWAEAAWILRSFCVLGAVNCVAFFNGYVLMAMGDSKSYFAVLIAKTIVLVVLCLIGVNFGIEGVVAAVVLGGILATPFSYRKMRNWIPINVKDIARALTKGAVVAVLAGVVVVAIKLLLIQFHDIEKVAIGLVAFLLMMVGIHFGTGSRRLSI